jgi:hypothetical protein
MCTVISLHISACSLKLHSSHQNIVVYNFVTEQDYVGYMYFPIRKVKETCPLLYSMFVYRARRFSSFVCAVISCPLLLLICIQQVLSNAHPLWWRSHVGWALKFGTFLRQLVPLWQMSSMFKLNILLQCFEAPSDHVGATHGTFFMSFCDLARS